MSKANKVLLWNCHIVCIERGLFAKHFKGKLSSMCLYREFTSEISLVISLDDWFTIGPFRAADNTL